MFTVLLVKLDLPSLHLKFSHREGRIPIRSGDGVGIFFFRFARLLVLVALGSAPARVVYSYVRTEMREERVKEGFAADAALRSALAPALAAAARAPELRPGVPTQEF